MDNFELNIEKELKTLTRPFGYDFPLLSLEPEPKEKTKQSNRGKKRRRSEISNGNRESRTDFKSYDDAREVENGL